jgi:hypothetical protein
MLSAEVGIHLSIHAIRFSLRLFAGLEPITQTIIIATVTNS